MEENLAILGQSFGRAGMPTFDHICGVDNKGTMDVKVAKGTGKVAVRRQAMLQIVRA